MRNSYIRLHISILLAGATGLFGRLISINELPLVHWRVLFATLTLAIVLAMQKKLHRLPTRHLLQIAGCGLLLSIHWVFFYGSIKAANVSIGAVCFALVGFFTALLEPLISRHRPSWRELLLSLITVTGVVLIFGLDSRYRWGIALGCISSFLYALFSITSKKVQASTGHKSSTMLLYELVGGGILLSMLSPIYGQLFPSVSLLPTPHDFLLLMVFASIFTIGPFLLQLQALRSISAFTVNLSYNLEPVYTISLAMILFGESRELNNAFWMGITLIVLSVLLQTFFNFKANKY